MHRPPTPATAPFIAGNIWRHLINMTLARSVGILALQGAGTKAERKRLRRYEILG